ncbi:unnamed protein product, partial [Ectocarpus sp. 12 AP-2014]
RDYYWSGRSCDGGLVILVPDQVVGAGSTANTLVGATLRYAIVWDGVGRAEAGERGGGRGSRREKRWRAAATPTQQVRARR